jgi:signal transduction histidine kinase
VLVNLCDNSSLAIAGAAHDAGGGGGGDDGGGGGGGGDDGGGGGGGSTGAGSASFTLTVRDGWVALSVADDGPGVAEAVRARLFEPYATTRRVGEGMGLGLAISRKILLDHGGDLELASSSAAGSVFRLLLPAPGGRPAP